MDLSVPQKRCLYIVLIGICFLMVIQSNSRLQLTIAERLLPGIATFVNNSMLTVFVKRPTYSNKEGLASNIATGLQNMKQDVFNYDVSTNISTILQPLTNLQNRPTNIEVFVNNSMIRKFITKHTYNVSKVQNNAMIPLNMTQKIFSNDLPPNVSTRYQPLSNPLYVTLLNKGRLGNEMYQYAALFGFAHKHKEYIPFITPGYFHRLRRTFSSISIPVLNVTMKNILKFAGSMNAYSTIKRMDKQPLQNISLNGCFPSQIYFNEFDSLLRKDYQFSFNIKSEVIRYFKNISPPGWNNTDFVRVGIQVRRTDRITPEHVNNTGEVVPDLDYFIHAMNYFTKTYERIQFIVASDDVKWCKENIKGKYVTYTEQKDYIMDMAILSLCDHMITSIGSYSWWAGWLCKGTTVYYGKFPEPNTRVGPKYSNNSMFPPDSMYNHWIPII